MKRILILLAVALIAAILGLFDFSGQAAKAVSALSAVFIMFSAADLLRWLADGDPPDKE